MTNDDKKSTEQKSTEQKSAPPRFSEAQERAFLAETLRLARVSVEKGSSPVGAIMVDAQGEIIGRGRKPRR